MTQARLQKLARWLILPFVFQALLLSGALAFVQDQAGAHSTVPVCTMTGLKWVDLEPKSPQSAPSSSFHCALCAAASALPNPPLRPFASIAAPLIEFVSPERSVLRAQFLAFSHPPAQAPPIFH